MDLKKITGKYLKAIMKIGIFTESFVPNKDGTAVTAYNHAKYLLNKGEEVLVVAPSQKIFSLYYEKVDGIPTLRLPSIKIPGYSEYRFVYSGPPKRRWIRKFLLNCKFDLVHVHNAFNMGRLGREIARKSGPPWLASLHGMPQNIFQSFSWMRGTKFEKFWKPRIWKYFVHFLRQADLVTVPSNFARKLLRKKGFGDRCLILSNGIDLRKYRPGKGERIRKKFRIPQKPIALHSGRMAGERKVDLIIKAAPEILKEKDVYFILAGGGRELSKLKRLASRLGVEENFLFTNFLPENLWREIYHVADLYIHPSDCELQGIVALEAMANELPLICCNKGALSELINDNGCLFKSGSPKDLAKKTIDLLAKDLKKMGMKSKELVLAHDLKKSCKKLYNIYEGLIG